MKATTQVAAQDKLFQLIQSLTKSEKRYFKLFSQLLQGEKEYLKLFDALEGAEGYNDKEIEEKLKGSKMLRQISVAKNYLYNQISRTLQIFSTREDLSLKNLLIQAQILLDKGLYSHAEKIARKAKTEAERTEKFSQLIEAAGIIRESMRRMNKPREFEVFIREIQQEEKAALQKQMNLMEMQHLSDRVLQIIDKSALARHVEDLNLFGDLTDHELLKDPVSAYSKRAELLRHQILKNIHRFSGEFEKSLEHIHALIELIEGNSFLLEENSKKFIGEIANAAILNANLKRYETALRWIEKLKHSHTFNEEDEARMFDRFSSLSIAIQYSLANKEAGLRAIEEAEEGLKKYGNNMSKADEMNLCFLIAHFYFAAGMAEKAIPWLHRILNDKGNEMRNDLQCYSRILHLASLLHLGKADSVEYYLQSYSRFIFKRGNLNGTEKLALSYFRAACRFRNPTEAASRIREYQEKLQTLLTTPLERGAMNMFDLELYFESLLQGKTQLELRQEMRVNQTL